MERSGEDALCLLYTSSSPTSKIADELAISRVNHPRYPFSTLLATKKRPGSRPWWKRTSSAAIDAIAPRSSVRARRTVPGLIVAFAGVLVNPVDSLMVDSL